MSSCEKLDSSSKVFMRDMFDWSDFFGDIEWVFKKLPFLKSNLRFRNFIRGITAEEKRGIFGFNYFFSISYN